MSTPIIETERLVLRPIETSDWVVLYPIMSDPVVMAHWDSTEIEDPDVVQQMVAVSSARVKGLVISRLIGR